MSADGFNGEYFSRLGHPIHKSLDLLLKIVWRNQICDPLAERFFRRVPKDVRECRVDTRDRGVAIDHDDRLWNAREQFAKLCPLLLEFVVEAGQGLQVPFQDIAAMH